jgi:hypothetical protein
MVEERWRANERSDGLKIVAGVDGYVIVPAAGGGLMIDKCPVCDEFFTRDARGLRGARLVADMLYPTTALTPGTSFDRGA